MTHGCFSIIPEIFVRFHPSAGSSNSKHTNEFERHTCNHLSDTLSRELLPTCFPRFSYLNATFCHLKRKISDRLQTFND